LPGPSVFVLSQYKCGFGTGPAQLRDAGFGTVSRVRFAAAIDPQLHRYLVRLARDRTLPIAEVNRRVGARAEASGRRRPSYAAVRLLVNDFRARPEEPSWGELVWSVAWRESHPDVLVDKHAGLLNKHLPEDYGLRRE